MPPFFMPFKPQSELLKRLSVLACIGLFLLNSTNGWCQKKGGLSPGHSRETRTPKVGFFFHPTPIFVSTTYKLGCEFSVGDSWSSRASLFVGHPKEKSPYYQVYDRRDVGLEIQFRRYFTSNQWHGVYGAFFLQGKYMAFNTLPSVRVEDLNGGLIKSLNQYPFVPDEFNATEARAFAIGPMLGYQYTIDKSIAFDLYIGAGFQTATISGGGDRRMKDDHPLRSRSQDSYTNGVILHTGFSLGLLFY
jgi:hypothetical protein